MRDVLRSCKCMTEAQRPADIHATAERRHDTALRLASCGMVAEKAGDSHANSDEVRPLPSVNQSGVKVTVSVLVPAARFFTNCASSGWPELPWVDCTAGVAALMASDRAGLPTVCVSAKPLCRQREEVISPIIVVPLLQHACTRQIPD